MKRLVAGGATAAILAAVVWLGLGPGSMRKDTSAPRTPEECIGRMFDAAARGDIPAYLSCFTAQELERLERELVTQTPERFADSLRDAVANLKGRAVYAAASVSQDENVAIYTVERIYPERTDKQEVRLIFAKGGWGIAEVRAKASIQPAVPYGTPVF